MAVLGLRRCTGFSLAAASRGSSLAAVCRLLITVASLVVKHGLQGAWASGAVTRGLSSCNSRPIEHSLSSCGAWACRSEARGVFLDQGLSPCLPHWQAHALSLSHQGSPLIAS